jgi:hypothetical protein
MVFFGCERQFRWLVVSRAVSMSHCKGMTLSKIDFDKGIPLFTDKVRPLPVRLALKRGAGDFWAKSVENRPYKGIPLSFMGTFTRPRDSSFSSFELDGSSFFR